MAKAKRKGVRIVFRKASPLTKAAVLIAVVLSTVALVTIHGAINDSQDQYEAMRLQAAALEQQNEGLSQRIEDLGSVESAIQIAMEQLGLVLPDTIFFTPGN